MTAWRPSTDDVRVTVDDGVAVLRLHRPEVLNALTAEMLADLAAGLRWYGRQRRAGAIVVVGSGRAFSSGDDLTRTAELDAAGFSELIGLFQDVTRAILGTDVAVVAALNGIAVGGAAEMALACDVRVGGPASDLLFPENELGLTVSNGSTVTLPAFIGPAALATILLGERIPAQRAHRMGLIDRWVDAVPDVEDAALDVAATLRDRPATALHLSLLRPARDTVERALRAERRAAGLAWERGLPQEGVGRFTRSRPRQGRDGTPRRG